MRLAIVTQSVRRNDGQGRVNYEVSLHALNQGVEVTLISEHVASDLLDRGANWIRITPRLKRPAIIRVVEAALQANRRLPRRGAPQVVVANGFTLTLPHQVNVLHYVHSAAGPSLHQARIREGLVRSTYERLYRNANSVAERRAVRAAATIVAVSEKVKDEAVSTIAAGRSPIVIYNGVDTDEFRPGRGEREALGLPVDVPLAIFVGDIRNGRKNLDTVLEALHDVPALHLAVAGETSRSPYPRLVRERNLDGRVHFLGFRADVSELLRAADAYVTVSFYEACSLALLEAMASGLPIIAAKTVGGSELLHHDAGIVLDRPDDVRALVGALKALLADPAKSHEMGARGREYAEAYTWRAMADRYMQLFVRVQNGLRL